MKVLIRVLTVMLALSWAAAPSWSVRQTEAGEAPTEVRSSPSETGEDRAGVEEGVREAKEEATRKSREKLVEDAVRALDETEKALEALELGDPEGALESLALAIGRLEVVVARNPRLALAPVDVRLVTYDLYSTTEGIEEAREEAIELLEDGRIQDARALVEGLRSDVVVEVTNLPLATYPAAIAAITPLIDEGEIEEAKRRLQRALNTMVVTQHVHPLPILRTEEMLARAEELATTEERTEEESEELTKLLEDARGELELAEALGYGEEEDFETFYRQLDEIDRKTKGGKSGTGFFDKIKEALRSFGRSEPDAS